MRITPGKPQRHPKFDHMRLASGTSVMPVTIPRPNPRVACATHRAIAGVLVGRCPSVPLFFAGRCICYAGLSLDTILHLDD